MAVPSEGGGLAGGEEVEEGNSNLLGWVINQADNIINQGWDRTGRRWDWSCHPQWEGGCTLYFFRKTNLVSDSAWPQQHCPHNSKPGRTAV